MILIRKFWPFLLIFFIVVLFFFRIFKGEIPFPGDLLVSQNPYSTYGFQGYAPGGYPNKAQGPDVIYEIYPWKYFSIDQLKNGQIPFWNPYNFSGNPQMANFQTAVFYPLNIFYFFLPFNFSWTLIILIQPLLAAIFMYLFLKKGVGLSDFSSLIGGISFGFCSYMTVWIEYGNIGSTLMFLPIVLLLTQYLFKKRNHIYFFGLSLVLAISILAGYIQGAFYIYILSFLYFLFLYAVNGSDRDRKTIFLYIAALFLPILITAFQLLPTLSLFTQSTRGAYTLMQIEKNLSPLYNLITVAIPDFFGNPATRNYWIDGTYIERVMYPGSLILFFALYSLFSKLNAKEKKFFSLVAITSLVVVVNFPLVKYLYLLPIPVISTTVPTRELSIFIFSMIILGSIGLESFLKEKILYKKFIFIYILLLILIWAAVFIFSKTSFSFSENLKITERNLILPSLLIISTIFAVYLKFINKKLTYILILVLVVIDLFYFFNKITPFSDNSLTYPKTAITSYIKENAGINRVWGYGSAYIPPNFQSIDKTFSPEGNDPLHISSYGQLLSSSKDGIIPNLLPRPDANIAPGYGAEDLKLNFYRKRILDLLGVRYVLHKVDVVDIWNNADLTTFPKEQFRLVSKLYPWQIYENLNASPRIFITGKYVLAKDKNQALSFIYNPQIDLKNTVILQNSPNLKLDPDAKGEIRNLSYEPNFIKLETFSTGNGMLFLSDNFFPEWSAKIDGKPSKIMFADYSFRALALPKGHHNVEFYYDPKNFKIGLGISAIGIIVFLFMYLYVKGVFKKF